MNSFEDFCNNHRIQHEPTIPYFSRQSRIAKRMNQTLNQSCITLKNCLNFELKLSLLLATYEMEVQPHFQRMLHIMNSCMIRKQTLIAWKPLAVKHTFIFQMLSVKASSTETWFRVSLLGILQVTLSFSPTTKKQNKCSKVVMLSSWKTNLMLKNRIVHRRTLSSLLFQ